MPALPSQKFIGDSLYRSTFNSPSKNREQAGDMEWHDLPICMHFSRPAHHSFVVLAGDIQFLSSPTRKKPAYLLGSTYSASYDNAMELVHGQVQYRHTTSNPGP